ncbi:hypothetical protein QYF61_002558 [Mycteria americana]|uniref:Tumor necrosis factor receptor superfamily member 18 n=1 Tax=Mycteria americana TaxID=33587 RepID=A0AAN7NDP5_MYCAM|nr:hypothetical protein QYF61_002558 [Mycteria americana]
MTEQTSEVCRLKVRACLLLVVCLWQWTQQTLATPCQDGELRIIGKDEKKCCPKCSLNTGKGVMWLSSFCILDFTFKCKPCETGTYSNVKNGWCRNWTDCESSGFLTMKQGNSTHNAICGFPAKDLEQAPITSDSLYTTILAILTAVAVFVLILLTFFLHFCIWSLKKEKYHMADDLEHNFPRLPMAPQASFHGEETYSCQFPEEEHGDKTPEEKLCYFHPQSLQ